MSHPDHFALFALQPRFAVDEAALEQAHRAVQSRVHPIAMRLAPRERRVAMQAARKRAYRTLKSPLARAAYLCERAGVPINAESDTAMPGDFLVQQMEWRERLDDVRHARDATRLAELETGMAAERAQLIEALKTAIDERHDHAAAARLVRQLMFIEKFRDEMKSAADTLAHPREAQS
jgi:molecular chaperone HscB